MATIKIDNETYIRLKALTKGYNKNKYKLTVADTIKRLTEYEWNAPADEDEDGMVERIEKEYQRLKNK